MVCVVWCVVWCGVCVCVWCSDKVGTRLMNNGKNDSQTLVQTEQYQHAHNIYIHTCDYITRKQKY